MSSIVLRCIVFVLVLAGAATCAHAGLKADSTFTERGKTDFDTVLQILNPYGTWSKIDGKWAYTPTDSTAPYTNGRWVYTEYGWYWKGRAPHSWATEHYGYWKRSAAKVWSWFPDSYWLPQVVEFRATNKYIGWRVSAVGSDGNFVEPAYDRYSKPEEWAFVTLKQFANPITPSIPAKPDVVQAQLDDSTDCRHTYLTYRQIDRPGPHPADFFDLSDDGGMLAPKSMQEEAAEQAAQPQPVVPPAIPTNAPAANPLPKQTGVHLPQLVGAPTDVNPAADTRKVKYWVTMSLPTYWTPAPTDAKIGELYIYRPDIFQDEDGIGRRIALWFNPKERTSLKDLIANPGTLTNSAAQPNEPERKRDPFRSPLDDSYKPKPDAPAAPKKPAGPLIMPGTNAAPIAPSGVAPTSP